MNFSATNRQTESRFWNASDRRLISPQASDDELTEFRRHVATVRRARCGTTRTTLRRILGIPLAIRHAIRGVRHYGKNVSKRDGVSLAEQVLELFLAYLHGVRAEDFYVYRLYLCTSRATRRKHFAFGQVLPMQQHLIETSLCPDYVKVRNKNLFAQHCTEAGLPTVPMLAEFIEGDVVVHAPLPPEGDLFSKPADLMIGIGTTLWRSQSPGSYSDDGARFVDRDELFTLLASASKERATGDGSGRIILQRRVMNHQSMVGTLTTGGLCTIRVVTCRAPSGTIDYLPAVIRMPVGDAIADNIAQGGLAAPISPAGTISGPAIRKDKSFGVSIFAKHPSTGVSFEGFRLPHWHEVLDLAVRAHVTFPTLHFIGWDIALLDEGAVLLEANAWWDLDLTLVPHGIAITNTQFIPYYNYHFRNLRAIQASVGAQARS